jgi:hypothetical protein
MRVHYHSPLPDIEDLAARGAWDSRSQLGGIDLRPAWQLRILGLLGDQYGGECQWPHEKTSDPSMFYTAVPNFSYGCAAITHSIIRHYRPRRVIEIGSGNSSKVIALALQLNHDTDLTSTSEYRVVDPFPRAHVVDGLPGLDELIEERVELLDPTYFDDLAENDILFIDSGHTVRTGGDVNYLILDILPRLSEGVIVHFHDIPLPYEYPKAYFTSPRFRVFWTEAYLLQAFMSFNRDYEVLLAMGYIMNEHGEEFAKAFPNYKPEIHSLSSGSFWIRRAKHQNAAGDLLPGREVA